MSSINSQDKELAEFFTDVVHLRDAFKEMVGRGGVTPPAQQGEVVGGMTPPQQKRILVIHGVGGVGKSSLLKMFRLHCKSVNVPVALASGDDSKSALDVLYLKSPSGEERGWVPDLKADGVKFGKFDATFAHYRAIQAKVDAETQKTRGKFVDLAGKAAKETAGTAAAAAAGAALGSIIPGIGTLAGAIGGMGAEALTDWLRGFLTKPDIDLLLDPTKKLTDDFLDDMTQAANKQRIVLMLDTFEQMSALEDWARDVAQRVGQISNLPTGQIGNLSYGVLLVIAGRALPNWGRAWSGWMANAQVEELKPMSEDVMRELIRRYYATMRGGEPNPTQVDAIIRFARGLPMVVTSAVQLWVKYNVEDFQSVKAEIVANLVDRLIEGVPSTLIPALEAAAIVRWFDQPILRAVLKQDDVRDVYNELRRFPFVRTRAEGLALHDAVREIMDENLRAQDSERHCELHERAAVYFEKRLEKVADTRQGTTGEEAERLGLERLYHRVRADEEAGIKLFQEMAEEFGRLWLINRLRVLLNDVNTYPLERENSKLWRDYYIARLRQAEKHYDDAEMIYERVSSSNQAEQKLRAYAFCDWGEIVSRGNKLGQLGGVEKATRIIEGALCYNKMDSKIAWAYSHLCSVYSFQGEWEQGIDVAKKQMELYKQTEDKHGVVEAYANMRQIYCSMGNWRLALDVTNRALEIISSLPHTPFLKVMAYRKMDRLSAFCGRYKQNEMELRECLSYVEQSGEMGWYANFLGDLTFVNTLQEKYDGTDLEFANAIRTRRELKVGYGQTQSFVGRSLFRQGYFEKSEIELLQSLATKKEWYDYGGLPEIYNWLGELYESQGDWLRATTNYQSSIDYRKRYHFTVGALIGLIRVKHTQGDYAAIPPLLAEAEQLAQQYEYNDHLASLRLTQGMTADVMGLNGQTSTTNQSSVESRQSVVIGFFKQAMIYALRYNRFLLDEVLSGRPQGTPLRPIIPYCLARGDEGRRMLVALRDWWKTGINDIGTPRPDTISPIPEAIALLEAERIAREREPGDGSPQKSVVEQIEAAL